MQNLQSLVGPLLKAAEKASEAILEVYRQADIGLETKDDDSPITKADMLSHDILHDCLVALNTPWPIISEESSADVLDKAHEYSSYWLIDPLDGTKEFVAQTDEFCINIALIHDFEPVLGLIYIPVEQEAYIAVHGQGAYAIVNKALHPLRELAIQDTLRLITSRRHGVDELQSYLKKSVHFEHVICGSAVKFCRLAVGLADCYPRFGPTSHWDVAAGHCLLRELGGEMLDFKGKPIRYQPSKSLVIPGFIALSQRDFDINSAFKL